MIDKSDWFTEPMLSSGNVCTALKADGTVWMWGQDIYGSLGDPESINTFRYNPKPVVGPTGTGYLEKIKSVSVGYNHATFALDEDGRLWRWGSNRNGVFGIGTTDMEARPIPSLVNEIEGPVKKIYTCNHNAFAILHDGSVYAWGRERYGLIGNGSSNYDSYRAPTKIYDTSGSVELTGIVDVVGNGSSAYFLHENGTVYGLGEIGELQYAGVASSGIVTRPQPIYQEDGELLTNVKSIVLHAALKNDGTVWIWGNNLYGRLGLGIESTVGGGSYKNRAVQIQTLSDIEYLNGNMNAWNYLVLDNMGQTLAWGNNEYQLFGFESANYNSPIQVDSIKSDMIIPFNVSFARVLFYKEDATVWIFGAEAHDFSNQKEAGNNPDPQQVLHDDGTPFLLWGDDEGPDPGPDPEPGDCCCKCCGPRVHFDIPVNRKYTDSIRRFLDDIDEISDESCQ